MMISSSRTLKRACNRKINAALSKRLLITQRDEGVYSFAPDLVPFDSTTDRQSIQYERPTPIIFISGECITAKIWFGTADFFSKRGYSGLLLSLPEDGKMPNIDAAVDYFEGRRSEFGLTPPIMVAHSISSFIAQKYLESYALKGLVLVNAAPPLKRFRGSIEWKIKNYQNCEDGLNEKFRLMETPSQRYYNVESSCLESKDDMVSTPFPIHFMAGILADELAVLKLEKGVVPMLVVATSWKERTSTKDENKDTTFELEFDFANSDESDVCEAHGLQQHNVQYLEISSGVPMTDSRSQNQFNELVYTWIDEL